MGVNLELFIMNQIFSLKSVGGRSSKGILPSSSVPLHPLLTSRRGEFLRLFRCFVHDRWVGRRLPTPETAGFS